MGQLTLPAPPPWQRHRQQHRCPCRRPRSSRNSRSSASRPAAPPPDDAWRDTRQQLRLRPDALNGNNRVMTIRKNHSGPVMSAPWRNATRSFRDRRHAITCLAPSPPVSARRRTVSAAPAAAGGGENDHPPAPCAAIRRVRRATPLTSMAVNGSSSTHSAARVSHRRASATWRCCPAESRATGTSSNPASPACASASGRRSAVAGVEEVQVLPRRQAGFNPRLESPPIHSRPDVEACRARVAQGLALPVPRRPSALLQPGQQAQQGGFSRRCCFHR